MAELIPLFPLSHVLLPAMPLPLHIFEQRYREMLADIAESPQGARFGVVALRSGTEAGTPQGGTPRAGTAQADAGPDVERVGTLAEILEIETSDDGTADLLAVGSQRFRIGSLVTQGTAYLRGEVDYLDEPDGDVPPEAATRARELLEVYDSMLVRLAGRGTGEELPGDVNQLSYHVAARLPLPPGERQELLEAETTAARLAQVTRLLRREIALLQRTRSIAVSPTILRMITGTN